MGQNRCGIYVIEQTNAGRIYIGSSIDIEHRWYIHRRLLNAGTHHSPRLQHAWAKHGPEVFRFSVLEECERDKSILLAREQEYLDTFAPVFNVCPTAGSPLGRPVTDSALANMRRANRDRAALITHCPKGHPYDDANTYRGNAKGKRICRACNALRVSGVYAAETPEQREWRLFRSADYYERTKAEQAEQRRAYTASHKEQKHAYDQSRAELTRERDHERRANRTPEELEAVREAKRAAYWRNRDKNVQDLRDRYRRTHPEPEPATACKVGHPYTADSFDSKGMRLCKPCRAISKRAYRDRLKEAAH